MEEEENLKDMIKKLMENQERLLEEKEGKEVKVPYMARVSRMRLRKNWITVMIIGDNRNVSFTKLPIQDGCIMIDGIPRVSVAEYTLVYRGKPMIIIPSWSLKPFSAVEQYEQDVKEQMTVNARKLILAKMKMEAIKPTRNFGMIGWIILIAILVGAGYYFIKGGKLF